MRHKWLIVHIIVSSPFAQICFFLFHFFVCVLGFTILEIIKGRRISITIKEYDLVKSWYSDGIVYSSSSYNFKNLVKSNQSFPAGIQFELKSLIMFLQIHGETKTLRHMANYFYPNSPAKRPANCSLSISIVCI